MKALNQASGENWEFIHGDCVEANKAIPDNSIHYRIFSPPFGSLYTYSNSERDFGNCKDDAQFFEHYNYLIAEQFRTTMPGRLLSFHCMNLPQSKQRDGEIGIKDFRGQLIAAYVNAGFIYHSEVCIWKDPVTAMQRTKALGLLHKQVLKDSCMSRQGIADYLVTMRKPSENPQRVAGPFKKYAGDNPPAVTGDEIRDSINIWQNYASPVWMDINPSDTLQRESARDEADERHICPLQLQVIERGIQLWSNPGDVVMSDFGGIASEGYQALKMGRKYVGIELKESYWKTGVNNLKMAEEELKQVTLI